MLYTKVMYHNGLYVLCHGPIYWKISHFFYEVDKDQFELVGNNVSIIPILLKIKFIWPFLFYFPYFEEKESMLMRSPCCLCVCLWAAINVWLTKSIFIKLGIHYRTWARLNGVLHRSLSSVCLSVCIWIPLSLLDVRTHTARDELFWRAIFYAVHIVSKESMRLILPRTPCYYRTPNTKFNHNQFNNS
jgi:hypothetical protein